MHEAALGEWDMGGRGGGALGAHTPLCDMMESKYPRGNGDNRNPVQTHSDLSNAA